MRLESRIRETQRRDKARRKREERLTRKQAKRQAKGVKGVSTQGADADLAPTK